MKRLILKSSLLMIVCLATFLQAKPQAAHTADPQIFPAGMTPLILRINEVGVLTVLFDNVSGGLDFVPAGSMQVLISFPLEILPNPLSVGSIIASNPFNSKFNWTYNIATRALKGILNTNIVPGGGGTITVNVKGIVAGVQKPIATSIQIIDVAELEDEDNSVNSNSPAASRFDVSPVVLPILLKSFTATGSGCNSLTANWEVTDAVNFSKFQLEVSSDGINYHSLEDINYTANRNSYSIQKGDLAAGRYFVRLKMIDNNGAFSYSNVVTVETNCNGKKEITVYPNPVTTDKKVAVTINGYSGKMQGALYTATGQLVRTYNLTQGGNLIQIDRVPQGTYNFKVTEDNNVSQTFKLVIIK